MKYQKLDLDEPINGLKGCKVAEFWSWAYSDIMSNRNRSIFAEFLIAYCLDVTGKPRIEWDAIDIYYKDKGIEIKSAAYIQSWEQNKVSNIKFDISKKKGWIAKTNSYYPTPNRYSDCYIFCLHTEKEKDKANVLDINSWRFYVITTENINKNFGDQKYISLSRIKALDKPVTFDKLKEKIKNILF